jgi:hypothetical protein
VKRDLNFCEQKEMGGSELKALRPLIRPWDMCARKRVRDIKVMDVERNIARGKRT